MSALRGRRLGALEVRHDVWGLRLGGSWIAKPPGAGREQLSGATEEGLAPAQSLASESPARAGASGPRGPGPGGLSSSSKEAAHCGKGCSGLRCQPRPARGARPWALTIPETPNLPRPERPCGCQCVSLLVSWCVARAPRAGPCGRFSVAERHAQATGRQLCEKIPGL